jgi:hypothetical protein
MIGGERSPLQLVDRFKIQLSLMIEKHR